MHTPLSFDGLADKARRAADGFPTADVRQSLDDGAKRGWTESTRRGARGLVLVVSDIAAGIAGVQLVLLSWALVSAGGLRPLPEPEVAEATA